MRFPMCSLSVWWSCASVLPAGNQAPPPRAMARTACRGVRSSDRGQPGDALHQPRCSLVPRRGGAAFPRDAGSLAAARLRLEVGDRQGHRCVGWAHRSQPPRWWHQGPRRRRAGDRMVAASMPIPAAAPEAAPVNLVYVSRRIGWDPLSPGRSGPYRCSRRAERAAHDSTGACVPRRCRAREGSRPVRQGRGAHRRAGATLSVPHARARHPVGPVRGFLSRIPGSTDLPASPRAPQLPPPAAGA